MTRRIVSRTERFINWLGDWLLPLLLTPRFYKVLIWGGLTILLLWAAVRWL